MNKVFNINMAKKKCNHYIPICLLKNWETHNGHRYGVHTFLIKENKKIFSNTRSNNRCSQYKFAMAKYFYVPDVDGERKINMEEWFKEIENTIAKAIKTFKGDISKPIFKRIVYTCYCFIEA